MFGLSFLSPLFLAGALAAAVPILLHLFHRKTDVVIEFPAVQLLTRAPAQQHRRRRFREIVLLVLRVAALILLAVSFARPYLAGTLAPGSMPLTVIAVDTSMSLTAPGQFERARDAAAKALSAIPASRAVALVSFADAPSVVVEPTTDRGALTSALAQLTPGTGGTRYRSALARISELIGTRDGHVVVVTDLQQSGWDGGDEGGLPDGVQTEVVSVPRPSGNVAITGAEKRARALVATVQNYGDAEVTAPVRVFSDGKEIAQSSVNLGPLGAADVSFTVSLPSTGSVDVRVDDPNGYQADNLRSVELNATPATPLAIVVADPTGAVGGLYLERALSLAGNGEEFDIQVLDGRDVARWESERLARQAAVFVTGTRTLDRTGRDRLREYLAQGGQVMLALGPDVDLGTLPDVLGTRLPIAEAAVKSVGATMVATDSRHPIFRPFLSPSGALGDVQVDQHRRLNGDGDRVVLARFSGGDSALTEQPVGKGRLLVFTSDVDNQWSRFPLNPAFVPFAIESARYLSKDRHVTRETRVADTRESNPAATSVEQFTASIDRTSRAALAPSRNVARDVEDRQRWWQVGIAVMLIALAGEAVVGRRTT